MKKLLILLLTAGLFTSCNNNKGKNDRTDRDTTKTSKDDYNSGDKNSDKDKDKDNTDQNKDNSSNNGNTNNNSRGTWSSVEVDAFITNCVSSAVNGGMQRTKADSYCNCMLKKLETLYPNVNDAGSLTEEDMNSPSMQRLVKDCLF